MIEYGIGNLLIVYELLTAHPYVMQLWYMDSVVTRGDFDALQENMRNLLVWVLLLGYF